jgi:hypothetical protein
MTYKDFYNDVFLNSNNKDIKYSFYNFIEKWKKITKDNNYIEQLIKSTQNYIDYNDKVKKEKSFLKKKRNNERVLFYIKQN